MHDQRPYVKTVVWTFVGDTAFFWIGSGLAVVFSGLYFGPCGLGCWDCGGSQVLRVGASRLDRLDGHGRRRQTTVAVDTLRYPSLETVVGLPYYSMMIPRRC